LDKKRVLVLGADGMVGHKVFTRMIEEKDITVLGTALRACPLAAIPKYRACLRWPVNACRRQHLTGLIAAFEPHLVINSIGIVKQSPLAQDPYQCIYINSLFPHFLAELASRYGFHLIHISTDCVFKGDKGNYSEEDTPDAIDLYGRTKVLGEVSGPHSLTIRTSLIGHELSARHGLVEWFLGEKGKVCGYTGHIFSGVTTLEFARFLIRYTAGEKRLFGIYHLSSNPISKNDLLHLIRETYGHEVEIEPVFHSFLNRSLDSSRLKRETGYEPPSWPAMISDMRQDHLAFAASIDPYREG